MSSGATELSAQVPASVQSPFGESAYALVETADGYLLTNRFGVDTLLTANGGRRLTSIVEVAQGWLAAGSHLVSDGGELVLLRGDGEGEKALPEPPGRFGFRHSPAPLVNDGSLVGIAWLEGDGGERNSVVAAEYTAGDWGAVRTVAPYAGGAQLALQGAVLEDGSWLLVWAAVAGEDDDIYWSRYAGGRWSDPELLHEDNSLPDILPAVAAVPGGALAVWSGDQGKDYLLRVSRFDGRRWHDLGVLDGEGSLRSATYPTAGDSAGFIYSTVTPPTWRVVEVAPDGSVRRQAVIPGTSPVRPHIVASDERGVTFRFADWDHAMAAGRASSLGWSPALDQEILWERAQ